MTKEQLIQLYQEKDRMRKRALYEIYKAEIELKASLPFIAKIINDDLGVENLIPISDLTYCRYFFKDTQITKSKIEDNKPKKESLIIQKTAVPQNFEIKFTDPDLNTFDKSIKSKFSKQ